jgi:subtilase family serine protease
MRRQIRWLAILVAFVAMGLVTDVGPRPLDAATIAPAGPMASAGRYLGPLGRDTWVDFTIHLELPGRAELEELARQLQNPASTEFGRFLTAAQIGARFGLPEAELARLERRLTGAGIAIVERFPQRTALLVRGTAASIQALFGAGLGAFSDGGGGLFYRPVAGLDVPLDLAADIAAVTGLDSSVRRVSHLAGPLLDVAPLGLRTRAAARLGDGEYVAIVSYDTFLDADIDAFDAKLGIVGPKVIRVPVGAVPVTERGRGSQEVTLDIDAVRMIAPSAQILNFEAVNVEGPSIGTMVDAVVKDGRAKVVTISWGNCLSETYDHDFPETRDDLAKADDAKFLAAQVAGVNVFVASGDSGPYSCRMGDLREVQLDPDEPTSSPNVLSVGGTRLSVRKDGTFLDEVGWEAPLSGDAGGGGQTLTFARPDWQTGPGVLNVDSNGMRQGPDVSGPADPESGIYVYYTDLDGEVSEGPIGGTSAASPFWAGVTVLMQGYARERGVAKLGYLNPTFYALATSSSPGTLFHDIVRGGNLGFDSGSGWDFATGLGSPRVDALAEAMATYLGRR